MQDNKDQQDFSKCHFDKLVKFPFVFPINACRAGHKTFDLRHFRLGHAPLKRIYVIHQQYPKFFF